MDRNGRAVLQPLKDAEFTIFLVDDDPAALEAISGLLHAAGYSTTAYSSAKQFLNEHDPSTPGCVVLEVAMPELDGLSVQQALAHQVVPTPIIFLTGRATIPESVHAMKAGAVDFLSKPVDESELLSAIRSAEQWAKTQRHRNVVLQRIAKLTRREREVLDLVSKGLLNKQISAQLGVHEKTIKVYRGRMFEKMGAKNVAGLVQMIIGITD